MQSFLALSTITEPCQFSTPSYSGVGPSPISRHLLFYWCDGTRSSIVNALRRLTSFQYSGRRVMHIREFSHAAKDRLLGPNVFQHHMKAWRSNFKHLGATKAALKKLIETNHECIDLFDHDPSDESGTTRPIAKSTMTGSFGKRDISKSTQ